MQVELGESTHMQTYVQYTHVFSLWKCISVKIDKYILSTNCTLIFFGINRILSFCIVFKTVRVGIHHFVYSVYQTYQRGVTRIE